MDTAHTSRWEISEVVFGIPLLVGIGFHFMFPLSLPEGMLRRALIPVGSAVFIAGITLVVSARREFTRYSQSTEPRHSISKIVVTGVFSISRNPLYLGIVGALSGIALVFNALWILIMLLPAIILCHVVLITPEERYLGSKFGSEYLAYANSVRRWIGRK